MPYMRRDLPSAPSSEVVRSLVAETLRRDAGVVAQPGCLSETALVQGGFYRGRRYEMGGWAATWWFGAATVALIDTQGHLRRTIPLPDGAGRHTRAA